MAARDQSEKLMAEVDIEDNPFYKALQQTFKKKLDTAQEKCYTVCIPRSSVVQDVHFTMEFVENHILAPSPCLKDHYITTDKAAKKTIEVDNDVVITVSGYSEVQRIRILAQELAYNKDFKQYKILVLDKPLCPVQKISVKPKLSDNQFWQDAKKASHLFSFSQSKRLLQQNSDQKKAVTQLDEEIDLFNRNYMVLPCFLSDVALKLNNIIDKAVEDLCLVHKAALSEDPRIRYDLEALVESYVMGFVHHKVFPVVCQRFADEDKKLAEKLRELSALTVTADQLGIREVFCCPQPAAVVELASLDSIATPGQKVCCLRNTIDLIRDAIYQNIKETEAIIRLTTGEIPPLTSDDLIPILVTVIIEAKSSHLISNLYYMEHFHSSLSTKDKDSFSLVTFQASVQYMQMTNFKQLQPGRTRLKKEISLEELMEATERLQLQQEALREQQSTNNPNDLQPAMTAVDRQLEKITKMIEASTMELQDVQNSSVERPRHQRNGSLGEFLCGLQENFLGVSFGKQT